jgi:YD repeat-containing protein
VPDASGTGHTATASGVTWSGGAENGGVVSTAGPVLDTTGSFTVSAWVNPVNTAAASQTAVSQNGQLCQPDTPPTCPITNSAFTLGFAPAGQFGLAPSWSFGRPLTTSSSSTFVSATSSAGPTAGTWTHLVGVYNASTGAMTLYVNGAVAGTATDTTPTASLGKLTIGQGETVTGSGYTSFFGGVSDVQVYQQALTSAQVTALYSQGRLSGANPTNKLTTTWALDQRGLPTSMTDPDNNVTYYSYDQAGRLAETTDPAMTTQVYGGSAISSVPVTMTGYDTFGEPTESSDANSNETVTAYDADGNPVSVTNPSYTPPGQAPIVAVSKDAYNSLGELTSETDPLNNATSYTYDQLGDVATQTDPDGGVTSYSYDTDGDQLSATGPTGAQSQATYDYLGRMVTSTQDERYPSAAAYTTGYSYNDPGGWLQAHTSPDGVKTSYTYDAAGEQASVTDGANNTTHVSVRRGRRPDVHRVPGRDVDDGQLRRGGPADRDGGRGHRVGHRAAVGVGRLRRRRGPGHLDRLPEQLNDVHLQRGRPADPGGRAGHVHVVDHDVVRLRPGGQPDQVHRRQRQRVVDHVQLLT